MTADEDRHGMSHGELIHRASKLPLGAPPEVGSVTLLSGVTRDAIRYTVNDELAHDRRQFVEYRQVDENGRPTRWYRASAAVEATFRTPRAEVSLLEGRLPIIGPPQRGTVRLATGARRDALLYTPSINSTRPPFVDYSQRWGDDYRWVRATARIAATFEPS